MASPGHARVTLALLGDRAGGGVLDAEPEGQLGDLLVGEAFQPPAGERLDLVRGRAVSPHAGTYGTRAKIRATMHQAAHQPPRKRRG